MNKRLARRYYGVCGNKYTSCIEPLEHERDDHAPEFGNFACLNGILNGPFILW